ncbi:exported protein of unknown function [Pseudorhizobium banfieldiae]|uniref:Uncharacterized protein n=1 Tax=Pseudorhizobium banfieldiae TaxID=1125847 RepID=L0NB32_9HYPH|nr:hypothetical protein [Pseudorhizobium banfieldiae]CAD6601806.1 hypothetical protein RNT25_00961 [arsenite-oxidising bacterium NT-25]CCF18288.1 exported protein of unknown function [Pseudorhizobium banfieldiae]
MTKTLLMAALFAVAGAPIAFASEGEYYRGTQLALGFMPVDHVVTGGPRWKHSGIPRMPTSRDNRLPNDDLRDIR